MKIVIKKGALRRLGSAKVQLSPWGEISGVPVSYRDNNGVYSAVQQITELRQTVGRVYQHQRRSPRLCVNASLTLHLCTAAFGEWPTVISFYPVSSLIAQSPPPPFFHLCSVSSSYPFLLFLPIFLTPPPPSAVRRAVTLHPLAPVFVCVCQAPPSRLIYYAEGGS